MRVGRKGHEYAVEDWDSNLTIAEIELQGLVKILTNSLKHGEVIVLLSKSCEQVLRFWALLKPTAPFPLGK